MSASPSKPHKAVVLIVDDTEANLHLLASMLASHGYAVQEAKDGASALAGVHAEPPDIILLDIRMPGMDGYEVCKLLKEDVKTRQIPVIFVSALEEQTDKVQGFAVGGVDYITKPFQMKEVLARLETHLTLRDLQRQLEAQNAQLQQEISERSRAEAALQAANQELEGRVQERTVDLLKTNQALQVELQVRKRAEQALLESQRFSQSITAATPGIVYIFDLEKSKLIYVNRDIGNYLGYMKEASPPNRDKLSQWIHPEDIETVAQLLNRWREAQDNQIITTEYRLCTSDGQWRWFQSRDTVFRRTPGGRVQLIIGTASDITERKQVEAERENLLAQVGEILKTVPEGMLLLSSDGKVLLANPVAESELRLLAGIQGGETLSQLGGRPLAELLATPPRGLWHTLEGDGRAFGVIAQPITGGPQPQRWVMIIRDITQEREIQKSIQQQERLAAVGHLAAGIAHDFNNILAVILLYTEMALGTPDLSPKLHERLSTIAQQSKRASALIQQILDFSRRAVLERRPMDLLPFVKEQVKLLERTLTENIKIRLSYQPNEYMVNADPTRMQQAIMNLVVNARDAMPEGGELNIQLIKTANEVQCTTCGQVLSGQWVAISFSDTGAGISPEALPRIFEPFFTTKEPGQGTGLGLAQVYGIVKQHEGHISVTSSLGSGSTFNLYLPALPTEQPKLMEPGTAPLVRGRGQTILVVEDEHATRQALVDGLGLLNYRVLATADGRQALELLLQRPKEIDLVLSDVIMPEMGGIALLHAIRENGLSTPVVFMTGHPMQAELEKLQEDGLAAWLLKPPRLKQLAMLIERVLG